MLVLTKKNKKEGIFNEILKKQFIEILFRIPIFGILFNYKKYEVSQQSSYRVVFNT
ncbi:hypothetical protein GCM10007962_05810 [Yeosuana aromativorans]|uniref:Uncharacterized protein n=1 Tax=Yeosuana aromativorans TaxID=288019 RepID=A0A8J3FFU9_9FLAO|nr:hypothetical protein GCM10007962_05810 [Yeosuana aromativorans]